jgi:hypothetical protein
VKGVRCESEKEHFRSIAKHARATGSANNWYVKVTNAEIEEVNAMKGIPVAAKWTWIRLKSLMTKTDEQGVLIQDGEPMSIESIARALKRSRTSVLEAEIRTLIEHRVLIEIEG